MNMFLRLIVALLLLVPQAYAAEKTKIVSLTIFQALSLHCVLNATKVQGQPICANLESYEDIIKEGDREKVVPRRYQYKSGVLGAMAKNILALQFVTEAFQKERALLQEKIITFVVAPKQDTHPEEYEKWARQNADYTKQANVLGEAVKKFNFLTFSDVELGIAESVPVKDRNLFPASILVIINPIREKPIQEDPIQEDGK